MLQVIGFVVGVFCFFFFRHLAKRVPMRNADFTSEVKRIGN